MRVRVLIISGSMGSGKTTLMGEASDILAAEGVAHAAIDVDALGIINGPDFVSRELMYRNLASVWENYASAGVRKLLLAYAVERRADLDRLRRILNDAELVVCRLTARLETMQARVRLREPGFLQPKFVARVAELDALLDREGVEDFAIRNDESSVTDVAREVLWRAGWLA